MYPDGHPVADLEHLVSVAYNRLKQIPARDLEVVHQRHLVAGFRAAYLIASGVLRIQPGSCLFAPYGPAEYNPSATAALTRVLMETAVNIHYFADGRIGDDEREFRSIIAVLHYTREREDTARRLEEGHPPDPPVPDDFTGIPPERQAELVARLKRENLPDAIAHWQRALEANAYYRSLPERDQVKWHDGLYVQKGERAGYYEGGASRYDAGFAFNLRERVKQAGISMRLWNALTRHLSSHIHGGPHALDQLAWFQPFDDVAVDAQITGPIRVCNAYLAVAIRWFVQAPSNNRLELQGTDRDVLGTGLLYFHALNTQYEPNDG